MNHNTCVLSHGFGATSYDSAQSCQLEDRVPLRVCRVLTRPQNTIRNSFLSEIIDLSKRQGLVSEQNWGRASQVSVMGCFLCCILPCRMPPYLVASHSLLILPPDLERKAKNGEENGRLECQKPTLCSCLLFYNLRSETTKSRS